VHPRIAIASGWLKHAATVAVIALVVAQGLPLSRAAVPTDSPAGGAAPLAAGGPAAITQAGLHVSGRYSSRLPIPQLPPQASVAAVAADPAISGLWSSAAAWPLVAASATLLRTGEVIVWDAWETGGTASVRLWNPATGAFTAVPNTTSQLFCAAQLALPDGRLLVVGGHNGGEVGIKDVNVFDPATGAWSLVTPMNFARWYPSANLLGDGRVVAISGNIQPGTWANTPEIYDPVTNVWTSLAPANTSFVHDDGYPLTYLMPNGNLFTLDTEGGNTAVLDVTAKTVTALPHSPVTFGAAVMYRPGQLLVAGGGAAWSAPGYGLSEVMDLTAPTPSWTSVPAMAFHRYQHNLVLLADGQVLAVGGADSVDQTSLTGPLTPELWDPATRTWSSVAAMRDPRMYHSTALLLPDGRVLAAGGGRWSTSVDYQTAEIYSPPYLFKGARPVITSAPSAMTYGATAVVQSPDAGSITSAALVGLGSVTHTLDMGQRYIPLGVSTATGTVNLTVSTDRNSAPPGYYMLFLINGSGVPSVASIVHLGGTPPVVAVTAPASGATVSGSTVGLTASATANVGAATVQFLVDGAAVGGPLAAGPYGMSWDSTTVPNGPHAVSARATDREGNSTLSGNVSVTVSNTAPPVTPPAFRSAATVTNGRTVNKPAGVVSGDLLLAALEIDEDPITVTAPAGWTLIQDTRTGPGTPSVFHAQIWTKIAGASEPATYTFNTPASAYTDVALLAYSGVNASAPIDVIAGRDAGVTAQPVTDSITTTGPNELLVTIFIDFDFGSWSAGPGLTRRVNFDSVTVQDGPQAAAGPTGTKTATNTSAGRMSAQILALRPR
jgi:hypothetical protein